MADIDDVFAEYEGGVGQELTAVRAEAAYHLAEAAKLASRETVLLARLAKSARAKADIADGAVVPEPLADEALDGP